MKKVAYLSLITLLFLFGCKAAEKQFREGDYDQAVDISVKKLQNSPDKEKYILLLEASVERANSRDLAYIESLHLEGQPERWETIYDVYQGISRRQNKVAPLLPLYVASENRDASFQFIDVVSELIAAKKNAAAFWYADAQQKLSSGNRYDARKAYYELLKIKNMYSNYQDTNALLEEAREAGMSVVGFRIENYSNKTLSRQVTDVLDQIEPSATSGQWFTIRPSDNKEDMQVVLRITRLESFPEQVRTNNYTDSKEVEDGWTYLYDDEGHVVKDSLGNAIKVTKYETITALITESWQEKTATAEAELRYLDARGTVLKTIPIKGDGVFQNYFANATGYYDAISPASRQKLGGSPVPFPGDEELLVQALQVLDGLMRQAMDQWNGSVLNQ